MPTYTSKVKQMTLPRRCFLRQKTPPRERHLHGVFASIVAVRLKRCFYSASGQWRQLSNPPYTKLNEQAVLLPTLVFSVEICCELTPRLLLEIQRFIRVIDLLIVLLVIGSSKTSQRQKKPRRNRKSELTCGVKR